MYGRNTIYSDYSMLATNVLMFMAVAINDKWKVPLGYFCVKHLNSEGKRIRGN